MLLDIDRPSRLERVVTGMLFVSVAISLGLTISQGKEYLEVSSEFGRLANISRRLLDAVERDLSVARVLTQGDGIGTPPFLTYVVPTDVGEDSNGNGFLDPGEDANGDARLTIRDGDVHGEDMRLQWGYEGRNRPRLDTPTQPHRLTLIFEPHGSLTESQVAVDVNADGDLDDAFERGDLVRVTSTGEIERFGAGMVVVPKSAVDGRRFLELRGEPFDDYNHDGIPASDETFEDLNGNGKWDGAWTFTVTFLALDASGQAHVTTHRRTIGTLNQGL